ncbi:MAG: hypothetical protein AAF411_05770 [Myxococcota bacterium]
MNIFRQLARIEAIDVVETGEEGLKKRASLLEAFASADFGALTKDERKELRKRLQRVIQSDADVILEAKAAMKQLEQERRNLKKGRRAANGYKASQPTIDSAFRRSA